MRRGLGVLLLGLFLCACGRKGALVPPEAFAPAPVTNLKVEQKGGAFQISWSAPAKEEGGRPLSPKDLAGFVLLRHIVLPPAEECDECVNAYSEFKRVDLDYLREVRQVDGLYLTYDPYLKEGETYQYKAVVLKRDGSHSKDSNKAPKKAVAPPAPPVVKLVCSPTEVDLAIAAFPLERGTLLGYNIYRWKKGEPEPLRPFNPEPLRETTYRDELLQPGITYLYKVRTAAVVDGERVESGGSNEEEGSLSAPD